MKRLSCIICIINIFDAFYNVQHYRYRHTDQTELNEVLAHAFYFLKRSNPVLFNSIYFQL